MLAAVQVRATFWLDRASFESLESPVVRATCAISPGLPPSEGPIGTETVGVVRHTGGMASTDPVASTRRHYADHRPYPDPPDRLADLSGPTSGTIELPITIDWGPKRVYDMGRDADRRVVYEFVLQEASTTEEVGEYVNGTILASVWSRLWLPRRVRELWEERFPELAHAA